MRLHPLPAILVALLAGAPALADEAKADLALKAASALYDGVTVKKLDNGLVVYLKPVPGVGTVSTKVVYRVGSADELLDQTGMSHYLEHLMFKGTGNLSPGDIDRKTQRNGGSNNAYTTHDYTMYHFDFASDRLQVALEIEADRMRNLQIDEKHEFQKEKDVVVSELEGNEDEPWDLENKAILPLLFGAKHPYGHPIIGERKHVKEATPEVIKAHYDRWYHPNNAALVVCGGFDPDEVMKLVEKHFGKIPAGKLPERKDPAEEKRKAPAKTEIPSKFDAPRLLLGYNICASKHPDSVVLDIVQGILTTGKTSRLHKKLVETEQVATEVTSGNYAGRYPGWFGIQVQILAGKDRERVERMVLYELKQLADKKPPTAEEVKRVQRSILADAIFNHESIHDLADGIARGVAVTDLEYMKGYLPRLVDVTPEDVQKVVKKYFDSEQRVTVFSVPKEDGGKTSRLQLRKGSRPQAARAPAKADKPAAAGDISLEKVQRVVLENGLTLLLSENHRIPIVVAHAHVRGVEFFEPTDKLGVATLTGAMLDEGNSHRDATQIASEIEDVGGILSTHWSGGVVKILAPDRRLGLELLLDCLSEPSFPKDAFEREQENQIAAIKDDQQQPQVRANQLFLELIYGKHPYSRPANGTVKTVEALTPDDCSAFHKKVFLPNNTILAISGDFDSKQVIAEVTKFTTDWKKGDVPKREVPELPKIEKFAEKFISMPDASQTHVYLGHIGIKRDSPDYFKLLVMDNVFGTGPGFTDRLSSRLRDREGLGYTVSGGITAGADEEPGAFSCYIGAAADKLPAVKKMFLEEIKRLRDEKAEKDEVEDAKKYLLGNLPFRFTTNENIANQLVLIERHGLGLDYLDKFRKAVSAVTPEDVQAMAKKYLDPEKMVLVAAGAINEEGKPLEKK